MKIQQNCQQNAMKIHGEIPWKKPWKIPRTEKMGKQFSSGTARTHEFTMKKWSGFSLVFMALESNENPMNPTLKESMEIPWISLWFYSEKPMKISWIHNEKPMKVITINKLPCV